MIFLLMRLLADTSDPSAGIIIAAIGGVASVLGILITTVGLIWINTRTDRNSKKTDDNTKAIVSLAAKIAKLEDILKDADRYELEAEAHINEWERVDIKTGAGLQIQLITKRPIKRIRLVEGE